MTIGKVLTTEEARQHIDRLQTLINSGLTQQLQSIKREGNDLSRPDVWEGRYAQQFRDIWPETSRSLEHAAEQLEELRRQVELINRDIWGAGGNG